MYNTGIYVHIPFCTSRCIYCDFHSSTVQAPDVHERYFSALESELDCAVKSGPFAGLKADTLYFGGGTPSAVNPKLIAGFIGRAKIAAGLSKDAEITLEANPETLCTENIEKYIDAGINRFSLGLQSASDRLLKFLGRGHGGSHFTNAVRALFAAGARRVSADILLGIPGQRLQDVRDTADFVLQSGVEHVSAYALKAEKGTRLHSLVKSGDALLPDDDTCADYYDETMSILARQGLHRYEISNFCIAGAQCRHNLKYWKCMPYLGLGASAHSYTGTERYYNAADTARYTDAALNGNLSTLRTTAKISQKESEAEYIMLGLRLSEGIDLADYKRRFSADFCQKYGAVLQKYRRFFCINSKSVALNDDGFYVQNGILCEFV